MTSFRLSSSFSLLLYFFFFSFPPHFRDFPFLGRVFISMGASVCFCASFEVVGKGAFLGSGIPCK